MSEDRLARIEGKVDKLTEVVTQVAVQQKDIDHLTGECVRIENRVDVLESIPKKAMWAAIVAAIVAMVNLFAEGYGQ